MRELIATHWVGGVWLPSILEDSDIGLSNDNCKAITVWMDEHIPEGTEFNFNAPGKHWMVDSVTGLTMWCQLMSVTGKGG